MQILKISAIFMLTINIPNAFHLLRTIVFLGHVVGLSSHLLRSASNDFLFTWTNQSGVDFLFTCLYSSWLTC